MYDIKAMQLFGPSVPAKTAASSSSCRVCPSGWRSALFCPITTKAKGYPFEVPLPAGLKISGVVLSDQVKSMDWQARNSKFSCKVPGKTFSDVASRLEAILSV